MKKLLTAMLTLCMASAISLPALALDYTIPPPPGPEYAKDTSVETVYTPDGGAMANEDVSKNAALIPPAFGSPSADALNTGEYLTPNLAPKSRPAAGAAIGGETAIPPAADNTSTAPARQDVTVRHTALRDDLYYDGGYFATLEIPALGVKVKVYQGTDAKTLAKGAGHFEETSIWDGNVALAGHNRGVNCWFGNIHELQGMDEIRYTTKLGTRVYKVVSVEKVGETDRSGLADSAENILTLYTCVRNESAYRWCVKAVEIR